LSATPTDAQRRIGAPGSEITETPGDQQPVIGRNATTPDLADELCNLVQTGPSPLQHYPPSGPGATFQAGSPVAPARS
jgi:hypothetical protein